MHMLRLLPKKQKNKDVHSLLRFVDGLLRAAACSDLCSKIKLTL